MTGKQGDWGAWVPNRWHVWSTAGGGLTVPEPVSRELWRRIRYRPYRDSADGNWREVLDEETGEPTLVLVRYGPAVHYRRGRL